MKNGFIIAGNWKMNKTVEEAVEFVKWLENNIDFRDDVKVLVFPPYISLYELSKISKNVKLGSQNLYFEDKGAFTGEISPLMLKGVVDYVLIGHSERRNIFKENDELLNKKLKTAIKYGFAPVFCVGESLEQRESGETENIIRKQIINGFNGISNSDIENIIIAYEPVWAIGTGKTATPQQAQDVHKFIRNLLRDEFKVKGDNFILYGGSVKPLNSNDLLSMEDIDGALIGGASLKTADFSDIIHNSYKILNP